MWRNIVLNSVRRGIAGGQTNIFPVDDEKDPNSSLDVCSRQRSSQGGNLGVILQFNLHFKCSFTSDYLSATTLHQSATSGPTFELLIMIMLCCTPPKSTKHSRTVSQLLFASFVSSLSGRESTPAHHHVCSQFRLVCPSTGHRLYDGFRYHTTDVTADAAISATNDRYRERNEAVDSATK